MPEDIKLKTDLVEILCDAKGLEHPDDVQYVREDVETILPRIEAAIHEAKIESAVDAGNAEYQRASKIGRNDAIDEVIKKARNIRNIREPIPDSRTLGNPIFEGQLEDKYHPVQKDAINDVIKKLKELKHG